MEPKWQSKEQGSLVNEGKGKVKTDEEFFNGVVVKLFLIKINKWTKIFPYNWNQMCMIEDWSTVVIVSLFQSPTAKHNEMKPSM